MFCAWFCAFEPPVLGPPLQMPKGQRFTFTIEPDLYEPLKAQAKKERRSIGSLLNWLASEYLEEKQGVAIEPQVHHGGGKRNPAKPKKGDPKTRDPGTTGGDAEEGNKDE